ncbi:hypothetical protein IM816_10120 [Luteibacter flocculans]|uniref:Uncharacterized protein n=1 Tax=Luteibacter flocculans TaxID=2780091 RepID=A0ABY4SXL4_9GAMM|nr:hypothetical protein [Luteibacter flocculans]URL57020.1 hypothetical protein IM816_10120 [Luteibacter flocculans]
MKSMWTSADLRALDLEYAKAGVKPHARPLRAAVELLGGDFSMGVFANPEVKKITEAYRALFPHVDETWPGMGIGVVVSGDQARKVTLGVPIGSPTATPWLAVGFKDETSWWSWCQENPQIAAGTALAFADLHDFANGVEALAPSNTGAADLWHMAASNLSDVGTILPTTPSVDSVLQPICLTAELSLKGALTYLGEKYAFKHHLSVLSVALAKVKPHRDDGLIAEVIQRFPDYVDSRYKAEGATRFTVVRLALAAQFIAASSVRRLGPVDLAHAMESDSWPGKRQQFL